MACCTIASDKGSTFIAATAALSWSILLALTVILPASTALCLSSTEATFVMGEHPEPAFDEPGRQLPVGKPVLMSSPAAPANWGAARTPAATAPALCRACFLLTAASLVCMRRPERAGVPNASAEAASTAARAMFLHCMENQPFASDFCRKNLLKSTHTHVQPTSTSASFPGPPAQHTLSAQGPEHFVAIHKNE